MILFIMHKFRMTEITVKSKFSYLAFQTLRQKSKANCILQPNTKSKAQLLSIPTESKQVYNLLTCFLKNNL